MGSSRDPVPVAVALGSNLGDRSSHLHDAIVHLAEHLSNLRLSSFHETEPVGVPDNQPLFLNAAATGSTRLAPAELLSRLLDIERSLGRTRPYANAPRTIDLDLILYGDQVITSRELTLPHPRFRERAFVLAPLAEIAGEWIDPVTGLTVSVLLSRLRQGLSA